MAILVILGGRNLEKGRFSSFWVARSAKIVFWTCLCASFVKIPISRFPDFQISGNPEIRKFWKSGNPEKPLFPEIPNPDSGFPKSPFCLIWHHPHLTFTSYLAITSSSTPESRHRRSWRGEISLSEADLSTPVDPHLLTRKYTSLIDPESISDFRNWVSEMENRRFSKNDEKR